MSMINSTGIVAFIHAKGSSERVPSKNRQPLGPMPLFAHAIAIAQRAELVDAVVIDSDDDTILQYGIDMGAIPLKRPAMLATNATAGDGLESWAAGTAPYSEAIAVVIPTSPFMRPESVDGAIRLLREHRADSVAAVRTAKLFRWEGGRPAYGDKRTSQAMPVTCWETTGLYVVRTEYVLRTGQRINYETCMPYEVSLLESVDIDTPEDLEFARVLWNGLDA